MSDARKIGLEMLLDECSYCIKYIRMSDELRTIISCEMRLKDLTAAKSPDSVSHSQVICQHQ